MSEQPVDLGWDMADRLRKALRFADLSVGEMAEYLDVNRNTVGRYINGHVGPDRRTLRLWAIRCGVPLEWLEYGELPRVDSNHQPAGWSLDHLAPRVRPAMSAREILAYRKAIPIRRSTEGSFARSAGSR